jgi:hypothetical protein
LQHGHDEAHYAHEHDQHNHCKYNISGDDGALPTGILLCNALFDFGEHCYQIDIVIGKEKEAVIIIAIIIIFPFIIIFYDSHRGHDVLSEKTADFKEVESDIVALVEGENGEGPGEVRVLHYKWQFCSQFIENLFAGGLEILCGDVTIFLDES